MNPAIWAVPTGNYSAILQTVLQFHAWTDKNTLCLALMVELCNRHALWLFSFFGENEWCYDGICTVITLMSQENHGVSNHLQLDCLFNRLFRQSKNRRKTSKLYYGPFVRGTTSHWGIPNTKGQEFRNGFHATTLWYAQMGFLLCPQGPDSI